MFDPQAFVARLAVAKTDDTFNFYRDGERASFLRERLARYLEARRGAPILLVGEAPGYRGARVSGIPFSSERQLTGMGRRRRPRRSCSGRSPSWG